MGPFPDTFADTPITDVGPVDAIAVGVVGAGRVSVAARCAARELANFYAQMKGFPDERLHAELARRCGSAGSIRTQRTLGFDKVGERSDAEILAHAKADLEEAVSATAEGTDTVGVAMVRSGDAVRFGLIGLHSDVSITSTSRRAQALAAGPADSIVVKGRLDDDASAGVEIVWGIINHGATASADCERIGGTLPNFELRCPVHRGDVSANVAIYVRQRGRFMGRGLAEFSVLSPSGDVPMAWAASTWGEPTPLSDDNDALAELVVSRINQIRAGAQLPEMRTEAKQALTTTRLAPHYFNGRQDGGLVDEIAMGHWRGGR